jgi:hypothetical protein
MKIGGRKVVHTASMIVPKGEEAEIEFNVDNWNIKLKILFIRNNDSDNANGMSLEVVDNNPQLSLINWSNSLGTATIKPAELGTSNNGKKVSFMLSHWLIGETNKLDIQFLLGGDE